MATGSDQEEQSAAARPSNFPGPTCVALAHLLQIQTTAGPARLHLLCLRTVWICRQTHYLPERSRVRLTAYFDRQLFDPATLASDKLLQHLLQPGKAGTLACQTERPKHCQRHFHQLCLCRRKEAVFSNRIIIVNALTAVVLRLRWRICVTDCVMYACKPCRETRMLCILAFFMVSADDVYGLQKHELSASKAVHDVFAHSCSMQLLYEASLPHIIAVDGK